MNSSVYNKINQLYLETKNRMTKLTKKDNTVLKNVKKSVRDR